MKYYDNYWNSYEKWVWWFFSDDEIDRRVKMWDLHKEEKYKELKEKWLVY